ncbi:MULTISPECIES: SDR family NAD(P)-dependent oxidoreductase [Streptomyces]|uniref:SDR family NAD(P)-dependent oxidoreductase n=1 Tax=Streptomyces TaxID=1883 RepID=UPI0004C67E25|nr:MULTISPECIES: SDR family NAD(P)-dependent oxidoreductase [Streptomyces]MBQ0948951.1 SDR family NAD(P)-dependent oxidoreductase [Streptomyces sp. RK76]MDX3315460.1 SDR family NAD(P)-dependent oxidoreductase [Streptomyces sp. ME03-5684b]MDX3370246.1 SDR family NAD(P)-dependent oxidoreductase [Streptomyces sp. ME02-6987-2C]MDX3422919.1 SDR family NAD(P)-dependent oxidoreductase [Streptomyces sp. ME02-6985-2c]PSK58108.1 Gluconate 5-dehydrogenase [Streptomyces sp. 111WW2]
MDTRPLVSTPFTASSTADEVLEDVDLTGVRAIVTGASSGLGTETARALTAAGAEVTLAVRNTAAGASAAETIARSTGAAPPRVVRLDLADRAGVTRFVDAWDGPLHLLVNNAGVVTGGLERTPEGWELHFATNHLGHFALATGLHQALARGAAERGGARIVSVSSTAHMRSGIDFDDLHFERRSHDPQTAYAQSKTANSLFAVEATRRWGSAGIVANAVNPGGVATGLQRNFTPEQKASLDAAEAAGVFTYKTVEQGAATSVVAAVAPEFAHSGGHYLDDGQEAYTVPNDADLAQHPHGVKEWALDPAAAKRLWTVSTDLLRS